MRDVYFFPKLTDKMMENCGFTVEKYRFSYSFQDQDFELRQKGSSVVRIVEDNDWKIESDGINIEKRICIAYPQFLYGKNGLACSDAEIGICIIWTNKALTQTGCIMPTSDSVTAGGRICYFRHAFDPNTIAGDLELSAILYIKKAAENIPEDETHLINEEGVSLGEIETLVVDLSSTYMEFPIEEYRSEKEPLWWVEFSQWEDPKVIDEFKKENICLYLNPYYSACPMTDGNIKNLDLLIDILATTYLLVFQRLNEDDLRATRQNIGLQPTSICSVLHQFIENCTEELRFESPERLLRSLQKEFRIRLMEGDLE